MALIVSKSPTWRDLREDWENHFHLQPVVVVGPSRDNLLIVTLSEAKGLCISIPPPVNFDTESSPDRTACRSG
jgi:hypothetical protein